MEKFRKKPEALAGSLVLSIEKLTVWPGTAIEQKEIGPA